MIDLGTTFCELAGSPDLPGKDGRSLVPAFGEGGSLEKIPVITDIPPEKGCIGRALRSGPWKLIHFANGSGEDQLFNLNDDPFEQQNLMNQETRIAADLMNLLLHNWSPEKLHAQIAEKNVHWQIINQWEKVAEDVEEPFRWPVPAESLAIPRP